MTSEIEENGPLNPEEVATRAVDLIDNQNTMTLATSDGQSAWAAPVYYVYVRAAFYFFSDPGSRHIQEGLTTGRSSAAIHAPSIEWRDICGVQMSGKIERIPLGREAASAFSAYLKKYPFCKDFFSPGSVLNLETFSGQFKAKLYKFIPERVLYQDNRIKFGHRELVDLSAG
ncbi:hypothetical protein D1AOALGA4SA_10994 [Olavius algarvensis Delta 1 endosymbiont]|nr:hypothetical protein D1AOALGA4SA_10994 [Olavius algarvensis Delta 1 endosymbiont]